MKALVMAKRADKPPFSEECPVRVTGEQQRFVDLQVGKSSVGSPPTENEGASSMLKNALIGKSTGTSNGPTMPSLVNPKGVDQKHAPLVVAEAPLNWSKRQKTRNSSTTKIGKIEDVGAGLAEESKVRQ